MTQSRGSRQIPRFQRRGTIETLTEGTVSANVEQVIGYLPQDSDKLYNWDETKIENVLEEYDGSLAKTIWRFWYERWSDTFEYISVKEGGTERPLNQIHQHAKEMLAYWEAQVEDEIGRKPISFGEIERPTGDC